MSQAAAETETCSTREEQLRRALFHGDKLRLVDAISMGALTPSSRVLDLCQRFWNKERRP